MEGKSDIAGFFVTVAVFLIIFIGIGSCIKRSNDRYSQYYHPGDTVVINGQKMMIIRQCYFSDPTAYRARLEDGTFTEILKSELIKGE